MILTAAFGEFLLRNFTNLADSCGEAGGVIILELDDSIEAKFEDES